MCDYAPVYSGHCTIFGGLVCDGVDEPDGCPLNLGEWGTWRASVAQLQDEGTYGYVWIEQPHMSEKPKEWRTPFTLFDAVGWSS